MVTKGKVKCFARESNAYTALPHTVSACQMRASMLPQGERPAWKHCPQGGFAAAFLDETWFWKGEESIQKSTLQIDSYICCLPQPSKVSFHDECSIYSSKEDLKTCAIENKKLDRWGAIVMEHLNGLTSNSCHIEKNVSVLVSICQIVPNQQLFENKTSF